jgi:UDP-N-acetyl-D-galactosamine dehydrogenase
VGEMMTCNIQNYEDVKIAIIGLGYVGLPLAQVFAEKYKVVGFDINKKRIEELSNAYDSTRELTSDQLKSVLPKFNKNLTSNFLHLTTQIDDIAN